MRALALALALLAPGSALAADLADVDLAVASLPQDVRDAFAQAEPLTTRHGALRLTDPALEHAGAVPWLLQRLATDRVPTVTRQAWAEALIRHLRSADGTWSDAWLTLAHTEADIAVQVILVEGFATADATTMVEGVRQALTSSRATVRAAAARAAGLSAHGLLVADALRTASADADASVRAQSLRTLGVVGDAQARTLVARALSDAAPSVRLQALRALQRLDPSAAREAAAGLIDDADPLVATFATSLHR